MYIKFLLKPCNWLQPYQSTKSQAFEIHMNQACTGHKTPVCANIWVTGIGHRETGTGHSVQKLHCTWQGCLVNLNWLLGTCHITNSAQSIITAHSPLTKTHHTHHYAPVTSNQIPPFPTPPPFFFLAEQAHLQSTEPNHPHPLPVTIPTKKKSCLEMGEGSLSSAGTPVTCLVFP